MSYQKKKKKKKKIETSVETHKGYAIMDLDQILQSML